MKFNLRGLFCGLILILITSKSAFSQKYLADFDTLDFVKDTVRPLVKKFENLKISGYIQPQFQVAQSKGAPSFEGGNFSAFSNNRFMLRRARVKIDYLLPSLNKYPKAQFTFQIDATERGVVVRDMFARIFETKKNFLSVTAGIFARPYGYEVNLSSAYRETPERGRMSQILLPSERDLGMMVSLDPQHVKSQLKHFKFDIGLFNGQGLSGTTDFDSRKDLISRLTTRPFKIGALKFSGGLSFLAGGWRNPTKYVYSTNSEGAYPKYVVDSSLNNLGAYNKRNYFGTDIQIVKQYNWGETEIRGEFWQGTQPGTASSSTSVGSSPIENGVPAPTYVRKFNGAIFYFLQNIVNRHHQLIIKYDWYDPNINVIEKQIGQSLLGFSAADIKYKTVGVGYAYQLDSHTKLVLYYDAIKNNNTQLNSFLTDAKDNIFTCRLQFQF